MADIKKHLFVRDRRDRLIDLLGFGETYPLRDLPVPDERLIVPPGVTAAIPVQATQRDCTYSLWEHWSETAVTRIHGGVPEPAATPGDGDEILIETPLITADISYRIRSTRNDAPERWVYLHALGDLQIGLHTALRAWVQSGIPLDPVVVNPADTDPRIVDCGAEVQIQVDYSQSGVDYHLVQVEGDAHEQMSAAVRGDLKHILLTARPITEDTVFRVVATMTLEPPNLPEQGLLGNTLPVAVRPNTTLPVTLEEPPILDHGEGATITIGSSQTSVQYQLYVRPIAPDELLRPSPSDPAGALKVAGEGDRLFTVIRPAHSSTWVDLPGFVPIGTPVPGNGGALSLPTGALVQDCLILVRAHKDYPLSGGRQMSIAVPLRNVVALLVRPDPEPALELRVLVTGDTTSGVMRVSGGQPGVFYHWSSNQGGADLGKAAYVYERRGSDPDVNRGINALVIGEDFVVGRDGWTDILTPELHGIEAMAVEVNLAISPRPEAQPPMGAIERATLRPERPIVDTGPLAVGTTLHGRAVRAKTGLWKRLTRTATIASMPVIHAQTANQGGPVTAVVIKESRAGDTYSILVNGSAFGSAQEGNGQDLTFPLAGIGLDARIELLATRAADPKMVIEQMVRVTPPAGVPAPGA